MTNSSKVIKVGNSLGLRLTKEDKQRLNIKDGDELLKTISSDGQKITFSKPLKVDSETQNMIDLIFKEDQAGIDALKDL